MTDKEWFTFHFHQSGIDEVNSWQPGAGILLKALNPGEPFLFKLQTRHHFMSGGGLFSRSNLKEGPA
jgi:putative restriction endonuclease